MIEDQILTMLFQVNIHGCISAVIAGSDGTALTLDFIFFKL